ncbi:MAG: leucine/isoleucine/valine transporter permease subunit [Chloroflexi bacterium]|nr:MAG: leucine/isoleucine/valine transporter permease subunit [Chloroflexota bacterium]
MERTMKTETRLDWRDVINLGLLAAIIALSLSVIGVVGTFGKRDIIGGVITMGHVFLFGAAAGGAYLAAQRSKSNRAGPTLLSGLVVGLLASLPLIVLILVAEPLDLRRFMHNVSPELLATLTFGQGQGVGIVIVTAISAVLGMVGAGITLIPARILRPLLWGLVAVFLVGLLSETIILAWGNQGLGLMIRGFMFAARGLSILGAATVFLIVAGLNSWWGSKGGLIRERVNALPPRQQKNVRWGGIALGILFMLFLPMFLRTYLSEVVDNIGIYVLMGLGLNIVVGFAGLLDLGYVAFFAIGAYTMAVLTSQGDFGIAGLSFWVALPIAVAAAVLAGIILGVPVLRMRGDYLAIVTLGFGEIIRILALSDALAPIIGGAQGILKIPNIFIAGTEFVKPEQMYYVILGGCLLAFFVSWRLRDARLGRQWMALREDEDVAEAMGINLVKTKLLAFASGAAFSGMSGAIFAVKLNSIFPHSFNLMVSINVLCLIIVGGMGSLPGVVVGALVLVGLPELLREFAEYRMLMYGALLIVMMLARPGGFWPSAVRKRELDVNPNGSLPPGEENLIEPVLQEG